MHVFVNDICCFIMYSKKIFFRDIRINSIGRLIDLQASALSFVIFTFSSARRICIIIRVTTTAKENLVSKLVEFEALIEELEAISSYRKSYNFMISSLLCTTEENASLFSIFVYLFIHFCVYYVMYIHNTVRDFYTRY